MIWAFEKYFKKCFRIFYFPPASKEERKLRLKASPQNKQQFFKKIKASMIWAFEKYFKKCFRIF